MKKIILLVATMLLFTSCDGDKENKHEPITNSQGVTEQVISQGITKITIEGHEYLKFTDYGYYKGRTSSVIHSESCPCHDTKE